MDEEESLREKRKAAGQNSRRLASAGVSRLGKTSRPRKLCCALSGAWKGT